MKYFRSADRLRKAHTVSGLVWLFRRQARVMRAEAFSRIGMAQALLKAEFNFDQQARDINAPVDQAGTSTAPVEQNDQSPLKQARVERTQATAVAPESRVSPGMMALIATMIGIGMFAAGTTFLQALVGGLVLAAIFKFLDLVIPERGRS